MLGMCHSPKKGHQPILSMFGISGKTKTFEDEKIGKISIEDAAIQDMQSGQ
ncbi:hypothetical protein QFZ73_000976 [Peribacillus sp. V2I11]|nr:hypothetical protein [Peribacillus sp. V2I11]